MTPIIFIKLYYGRTGMFGPAGMAGGGMWGAGFGSSLARSFCS